MIKRKIIQIDEEKCTGCGACADACHEGAIAMVDGKARLMRDDYCDGLGDCLPACPVDAISFVEREALAYDAQAVLAARKAKEERPKHGCPGMQVKAMPREQATAPDAPAPQEKSMLRQWPVQIKLVPTNAPYFAGADLLIAADCSAFARADFHERFMKGRITLIGCPKLDGVDYSEKLTRILADNNIQSICVVRMEVPCCGGLEHAVRTALENSGKRIPLQVVTLSVEGRVLDD